MNKGDAAIILKLSAGPNKKNEKKNTRGVRRRFLRARASAHIFHFDGDATDGFRRRCTKVSAYKGEYQYSFATSTRVGEEQKYAAIMGRPSASQVSGPVARCIYPTAISQKCPPPPSAGEPLCTKVNTSTALRRQPGGGGRRAETLLAVLVR